MRESTVIKLKDRSGELTFKITEMPASKMEAWLMRFILLLTSAGVSVPDGMGLEETASFLQKDGLGLLGKLDYDKVKPLLDDMLVCCSRMLDGGIEQPCTPEGVDGYIEDVTTLLKLRFEAVKYHFRFFGKGSPSSSQKTPHIKVESAVGAAI